MVGSISAHHPISYLPLPFSSLPIAPCIAAVQSMYARYKSVGHVCGEGGLFAHQRLGEGLFLYVPIDRCFSVMRVSSLAVCMVSQDAPSCEPIACIAVQGTTVYVACGSSIFEYQRTRVTHTHTPHTMPVLGMLLVGPVLLSFDDARLHVSDTASRERVRSIAPVEGGIRRIMHPAAYVNKVRHCPVHGLYFVSFYPDPHQTNGEQGAARSQVRRSAAMERTYGQIGACLHLSAR